MNELKDKHIYIIEDDAMNLAVNAATLRRSGAKITQDFWNVGSVQIIVQKLPIDVILLDLMLRHNLNGYDIFGQIRELPALASIPVVAVSAADPAIEIPKAKRLGFAGFIGKPIRPRLFAQQIADCLEGRSVWTAITDSLGEQ